MGAFLLCLCFFEGTNEGDDSIRLFDNLTHFFFKSIK